jgi:hypothetical protein
LLSLVLILSGTAASMGAAAYISRAVIVMQDSGSPARSKVEQAEVEKATKVKERHADSLMRLPIVVGVGVGASKRYPRRAAIHLFVRREPTAKERRRLPSELEGVPVELQVSGEFKTRPDSSRRQRKP